MNDKITKQWGYKIAKEIDKARLEGREILIKEKRFNSLKEMMQELKNEK